MTGISTPNDSGILLDAGTNEFEVLVFCIGDQRFGVNVAKVREVVEIGEVVHIPDTHPAVEGVVRIRQEVVQLVNLAKYLFPEETELAKIRPHDRLLLLEFNNQRIGFRVCNVERIFRISWNQSNSMPDSTGTTSPVTSVIMLEGKLLQMLDFESIGILVGLPKGTNEQSGCIQRDPVSIPILFAEDSKMISAMIEDELTAAGFENIKGFTDGSEAWEYLDQIASELSPEELLDQVGLLISDVEMPKMDGLNLCKRVRSHDKLKELPVILFSSLISKDNHKKGVQVGATSQIAKPHYGDLVAEVHKLLSHS